MQSKLIAVAAALGLIIVTALFFWGRAHPPGVRPIEPHYDQVFKYCSRIPGREDAALADIRKNPLYTKTSSLPPGEYALDKGGYLYKMGSGMFEILLPPELQVVRKIPNTDKTFTSTDHPRSIIGCSEEQAANILKAYGLSLQPLE